MDPIVILDNEFCTLWYHPDTKIIHHQIKKFITGDAFKELFNTGYDTLVKNAVIKWFSDDRNMPILNADDGYWAKTDWFPRVKAAGWKHWAKVWNIEYATPIAKKSLTTSYNGIGINAKLFSDADSAMQWLIDQ